MTCKPDRAAGPRDVFSFGDEDMQAQSLRNLGVMMALPWAAAWALGAELTAEALRRTGL